MKFSHLQRLAVREDVWLYILIFLLPLQTRWMLHLGEINGGYWEYGTIALYAVDLVVIALVGRRVARAARNGGLQRWLLGGARRSTFWLIAGILELAVVVSILYAMHDGLALYGYTRFVLAMGVAWLVLHGTTHLYGIGAAMMASGAVQGGLALWQVFTQRVTGSTLLGMAQQNAVNAGVSVVEYADERLLRAYGSLPHPNILAGWLAVVIVIGIAWQAQQLARDAAQPSQRPYAAWWRWFGWLALGLSVAGLVVTFSRAGWLAAAAGVAVYGMGMVQTRRRATRAAVASVIAMVVVVAAIVGSVWHEPILSRVSGEGRLETRSLDERARYAQDAYTIITHHPLGGVGMHNYGRAVWEVVDRERPAYQYEPVHNTLLLVWAEIGIMGIAALSALLAYVYARALAQRTIVAGALALTLTLLAVFDHWLWSLPFGLYVWWLSLACALRFMRVPAR